MPVLGVGREPLELILLQVSELRNPAERFNERRYCEGCHIYTLPDLHLAEILMHKLYRDRSFSYSRRDPLHRTMPHIADREDAGHTGFEQARIAFESPAFRTFALVNQIGAGENETAVVAIHD